MNPDFAEMLAELSAANASFMVVGAHAVAAHARPRATGDLETGRIDILTSIEGVDFDDAWPRRTMVRIGHQSIPVLGKSDLLRNKRAVGRPKDLADIDELERAD